MVKRKGVRVLLAAVCVGALVFAAAACAPAAGPESSGAAGSTEAAGSSAVAESEPAEEAASMGSVPYVDNDTVVLGTLGVYVPADDAAGPNGEAMEEDELQQERIAGGAVGEVVSENLEPLTGIVDYSDGEYEPVYGVEGK